MERRTRIRKRTETRVFLHHPDLPGSPCTTRDLSPEGVFVFTPNADAIAIDTELKMTFAVDLGAVTRLYEFEGTVVRRTGEGLALAIDRFRPMRAAPHRVNERHGAEDARHGAEDARQGAEDARQGAEDARHAAKVLRLTPGDRSTPPA